MNKRAARAALKHWREIKNPDVLSAVIHTAASDYALLPVDAQKMVYDALVGIKWSWVGCALPYEGHPGVIADTYVYRWYLREKASESK